jgi:hypothetical protein
VIVLRIKKKESESDNYIKQYIHFYFVNLIEDYSLKVPVFEIEKFLLFSKTQSLSNLGKNLNKLLKLETLINAKSYARIILF